MEIFIDIGNTNASFWKDGKTYYVSTQDFAKNNCLDFLKTHNPTKVFVASVVPKVSDSLENSCKEIGISCKNIEFWDIPLQTNLQNNSELGIDRAINAFHGMQKFGENVIIVDFGTALTFDVVHNGVYQGGMIFPGITMAMHNLHTKTAKLPSVHIEKFQSGIGKTTIEAISFGAVIGYEGVLKNTLFFIENDLKTKFKIVFTGGCGKIFFNRIDGAIFEENLILEYLVGKYGKI
jgi:type III pantothenate kinase